MDPKDWREDERARQVKDWLEWWGDKVACYGEICREPARPVTAFAAVDDEEQGFALHGIPAVITDGKRGMTAEDADRLIAILGRAG